MEKKTLTNNEISLFKQIAFGGDVSIAHAVGKRYLLGTEGFPQDYSQAKQFLTIAANANHAQSIALLGYMFCLGLGTPQDLKKAETLFVSAARYKEGLGLNGLGFLSFQDGDLDSAFKYFNESSQRGSADGMFNLASMYLTGTGATQNFNTAFLWYAQALERGHTPAAYALAIMHLNGIGTARDCQVAVKLLKEVSERGEWTSNTLLAAQRQQSTAKQPASALISYLQLAEAGHEVSQSNLAHLLDFEEATLFPDVNRKVYADNGLLLEIPERDLSRVHAQRFYEMSAEQGSVSSELRLGDFAYYGWGMKVELVDYISDVSGILSARNVTDMEISAELQAVKIRYSIARKPDYEAAFTHYKRAAEISPSQDWMARFIGRARFNLGYMHEWGLGGLSRDLTAALKEYEMCQKVHPGGSASVVAIMRAVVLLHEIWILTPEYSKALGRLWADKRIRTIFACLIAALILIFVRSNFARAQAADDRPAAVAGEIPTD